MKEFLQNGEGKHTSAGQKRRGRMPEKGKRSGYFVYTDVSVRIC